MIYKEKMEEILQHYGVKGMTWDDSKNRLDEADKKVVANPKKSAKTDYAETKEFIKNLPLPKKKKKSTVNKSPVMKAKPMQDPQPAKGSIASYNRQTSTGRKTTLEPVQPPKTKAKQIGTRKKTSTTHFDKYTTPSNKEFNDTINRVKKDEYNKLSPIDKIKYNIRKARKK